jgi:hypothetical protein
VTEDPQPPTVALAAQGDEQPRAGREREFVEQVRKSIGLPLITLAIHPEGHVSPGPRSSTSRPDRPEIAMIRTSE